jgi:hypothetical protein
MIAKIGWIAALSLLLGIGISSQAGAETFEQQIAGGVGFVDSVGDDLLVGNLMGKGGPGSSNIRIEIAGGLELEEPTDCPEGFLLRVPVVRSNFVATFKDLSLLSGRLVSGFVCRNVITGDAFAVVEGEITGGNGRFEGATGTWKTTAEAQPAGFVPGFEFGAVSFRVTGTIVYDLD